MNTAKKVITFERLMRWWETEHNIVPPFSQDEQAIALAAATAHFYCHTLNEEMPDTFTDTGFPGYSMVFGIQRVCDRRAGRI